MEFCSKCLSGGWKGLDNLVDMLILFTSSHFQLPNIDFSLQFKFNLDFSVGRNKKGVNGLVWLIKTKKV